MKFNGILLIFLLVGLGISLADDSTSTVLKIDKDAPTFYLKDIQGKDMFLRDYCGTELRQPWKNKTKHVIVLSFFATWCVPCQKEIPHLEALQNMYANQPVKFFIIDVGEKKAKVEKFIQQKGYNLPVLLDIYKIVSVDKYNVVSLPQLVVIDKEGKIVLVKTGFKDKETLYSKLIPVIEGALKDGR